MKKTREYYEALIDFGFAKGEKLTKAEEEQHKANLINGVEGDANIAEVSSGVYRRVNDEPDMEAFIKWYMLKSLYFSRAIRSCLVFFVVIAVIGIAIGLLAYIVPTMLEWSRFSL